MRLALATSILVVVVTSAQSWLLARHDLDHVRGYLEDRGRRLATELARETAHSSAEGDLDGMQRLVEQARTVSGALYARVLDRHGLLLAVAGQRPLAGTVAAVSSSSDAPILVAADVWEFRETIALAASTTAAGDLGTVAVGISLEPLQALRRRRLTMATVFTILSTLIGVLGAGLLARAMTRPLRALAAAADQISRGDFAARVRASTGDEVGRLAGSFNAMAESVEEKVRELERANHLKSEFLATVSHELRTPLNVILGYTEMLAEGDGGMLTATQAEMVASIRRYSRDQLDLITSVLDFTRLSSGKVSLNLERFALAPLLTEIQALYAARLRSPRVSLSVTVDAEVAEVETDRVKLQEIVRNLVDNASKFTEEGSITVRAYGAAAGWATIDVADTGPGIPAEDAAAIFDAFHQVGASKTRSTGGIGLGLSIVRQLAEALGGRVSVTSRLGEGALFRVEIPCAPRPLAVAEPTATAALDAAAVNAATVPGTTRPLRAVPSGGSRVRIAKS